MRREDLKALLEEVTGAAGISAVPRDTVLLCMIVERLDRIEEALKASEDSEPESPSEGEGAAPELPFQE